MANEKVKEQIGLVAWLGLFALFLAVFIFSGCKIYGTWCDKRATEASQKELQMYKPQTAIPEGTDSNADSQLNPGAIVNSSLLQLQEKYSDVCGWLDLDGTKIDYCFAQGQDNNQYLRHDLDGEYLVAGTIFLDYRCSKDFTGVNSILYGHKMKNGTMFADLARFEDPSFFDTHTTGTIWLPYKTFKLEIVAYLLVSDADPVIYDPYVSQADFLSYVRSNATQYRESELSDTDQFLTFSTCSDEYDGARSVLIAKILY